jgi:hypothetical protein
MNIKTIKFCKIVDHKFESECTPCLRIPFHLFVIFLHSEAKLGGVVTWITSLVSYAG